MAKRDVVWKMRDGDGDSASLSTKAPSEGEYTLTVCTASIYMSPTARRTLAAALLKGLPSLEPVASPALKPKKDPRFVDVDVPPCVTRFMQRIEQPARTIDVLAKDDKIPTADSVRGLAEVVGELCRRTWGIG